jgi:hypothetical protein
VPPPSIVSHPCGLDQPRPAHLDQRGIEDLTCHCQPALGPEQRIKPHKQPLCRAGAGQLLTAQPDRVSSGTESCMASPTTRMNLCRALSRPLRSINPRYSAIAVSRIPDDTKIAIYSKSNEFVKTSERRRCQLRA